MAISASALGLAPGIDSRRMVSGGGTTSDATGGHPAPPADGSSPPAVRLTGVRKSYGEVVAIDELSLEVREGEFFTMLGPSGSGKTTTLRIIAGFETADAGRIELHGVEATGRPHASAAAATCFKITRSSRT